MSSGISPASSRASVSARAAIAFSARLHWCSENADGRIRTRYGVNLGPLHLRQRDPRLHVELEHLAGARVLSPTIKPRPEPE